MATTRLYAPRPYDEFDSGVAGVAPILSTGTDVDNTKVTAVQAAATASGIGTLPTSAGGTAPAPVAEPLRSRGPWQINTVYSYGDVVSQGGSLYVAPTAFTSGSSFVAGNWTKLGVADATDPSFSATYEAPTLPEAFGALGDGATDDTAALAAWAASGKTMLALQPNKTYLTTATVVLPVAAQFDGHGSTIKASGVIAGPLLRTSAAQSREGVTRNVILACDNKAQTGFTAYWVAQHTLADVTVYDAASHAVILGDPTPGTSYGVGVYNLTVDRPSRTGAPAGSFALWCRNSTDNIAVLATLIGNETGVRNDTGDNMFIGVHVWGYSTSVPITCFDDNATGGQYDGCIADTPTTQGWLLRTAGGGNVMIRGGKTYVNNVYGVDNTVTGVKVNDVGSVFFSVIGHHFQGADATHRLLRDVSVTDANNPMYVGNQYTNVVNALNPANRVSGAFQVNGQSTFNGTPNIFANAQIFASAGNTRYVTYSTGGSVAGASSRWQAGANSTAEGGSNAGSDWDLVSRSDAGAFLATVMHAIRANGVVQFDAGSIAVHVKGGTPSDADYAVAPPNGTFVADSTGSKLWVRLGGAWKSVAVA